MNRGTIRPLVGSAFCTVKRTAFTSQSKIESLILLGGYLALKESLDGNPGILAKSNVDAGPSSPSPWRTTYVQIGKFDDRPP